MCVSGIAAQGPGALLRTKHDPYSAAAGAACALGSQRPQHQGAETRHHASWRPMSTHHIATHSSRQPQGPTWPAVRAPRRCCCPPGSHVTKWPWRWQSASEPQPRPGAAAAGAADVCVRSWLTVLRCAGSGAHLGLPECTQEACCDNTGCSSPAAAPYMPPAPLASTHTTSLRPSPAHRCSAAAAAAATALGAAPAAAPHGCAAAHGVPEEVVTAAADGEVAILAALHGAAGAGWLLLQGQKAAGEGQIACCGAVGDVQLCRHENCTVEVRSCGSGVGS